MPNTNLNVRTDAALKGEATEILSGLGLNLSSAINLFLKQVVLTKGLPFEVRLDSKVNKEAAIRNVAATLAMEGMALSQAETSELGGFYDLSEEEQESEIADLVSKLRRNNG